MTVPDSESEQREVFRILVAMQDQGTPVPQSRQQVATQFDLSLEDVIQIERNGVQAKWPPLA